MQDAIIKSRIEWQRHALEKMMERGISRKAVRDVLLNGKIIESYPDDKPYPNALFLGWVKNQPERTRIELLISSVNNLLILDFLNEVSLFRYVRPRLWTIILNI